MSNTNANATASTSRSGIGIAGLLTIVFVILKLNPGGYLDSPVEDWSWWWVFSPLWIAWGIVLGILAIIGLGVLGATLWDDHQLKKRRKAQVEAARKKRGLPPLN